MQLNDGRGSFKGPVFNLRDLVVAQVSAGGESSCREQNAMLAAEKLHSHFLQLGKALEGSTGLQGGDVIVVEAAAENKLKCSLPITGVALEQWLETIKAERLFSYSSLVDEGMCSGILVSFRLEQSTTLDSQRHLGGHTGSLLQALLRRVSSVPERETTQTLLEDNGTSLTFP